MIKCRFDDAFPRSVRKNLCGITPSYASVSQSRDFIPTNEKISSANLMIAHLYRCVNKKQKNSKNLLFSDKAGDKDFQSDTDQNDAAQNICLTRQLGTEPFADFQSCHADHKGYSRNDECRNNRHHQIIF